MRRSNEALWWSLFSAGGVMAALFIPALILVSGFLLPTRAPDAAAEAAEQVRNVVSRWPVRVVLFMVIFLSFFHCSHRVRHTLMDLGLRRLDQLLTPVCYIAALAGTVVAGIVLVRI